MKADQTNQEQQPERTDTAASSKNKLNENSPDESCAPNKEQQPNDINVEKGTKLRILMTEFERETRMEPRRQIVRQIRRELNLSDRGPLPRRIFRGDDGTIAKLCKDLGWHEKGNHAPSAEPRTPRTDTRETNSGDRPNTRTQKGKRRRKNRDQETEPHIHIQAREKSQHQSDDNAKRDAPARVDAPDTAPHEPAPAPPPCSPPPSTCTAQELEA